MDHVHRTRVFFDLALTDQMYAVAQTMLAAAAWQDIAICMYTLHSAASSGFFRHMLLFVQRLDA